MFRLAIRTSLIIFAVILCWGCGTPPTAAPTNAPQATMGGSQSDLRLTPPAGWVSERPTSTMRVSQYQLPAADGDSEAASLVVYYFGPGQGGSVSANLDRWMGQMQPSPGQSSDGKAKTESTTVNGMKVTLLDVAGTYAGGDMGGGGGGQAKPNYRMRAGVIETPKGAYFIKLVGPEKTVARWDLAFQEFVKSAEFKG